MGASQNVLCCTLLLLSIVMVPVCLLAQVKDQVSDEKNVIRGIIKDAQDGTPIPWANVFLPGSQMGTSSDFDGRFILRIPTPGNQEIRISYLGYTTWSDTLVNCRIHGSNFIEVELVPTAILSSEVVVTATAKRQSIALAPASITVVTARELSQRNVITFDEAFDVVPGVQLTRSSEANVQALSIRGASEVAGGGIGNRVLLLIDGRPALSPESGGALWNLVPTAAIERIEVVKGAYSSLYGSSAMGGVVNVITKTPTETPRTQLNVQYGFYGRPPSFVDFDRYSDFSDITMSHARKAGDFDLTFTASRKANDGHREKAGYELYNFYTKTKYLLSGERNLQLSVNANIIDNDTPATWLSPSQPYSVAPHRQDDFQYRREYNADLLYTSIPNGQMKYSSRLYYYQNHSRFVFDSDPGNDSTNVNFGKQSVAASSVRAQRLGNINQYDVHLNETHYIIAGNDIKYDQIVGLPDSVLYGRHKSIQAGLYIQDEITLSPVLTLTAGIRYDHFSILNEFSEGTISPKLSMVYKPGKKTSYRMLFAQAFRNPSIAERFIKFEQGGGLRFQPNASLKAERLDLSLESGILHRFSKNLSVDAALYYNHYRNLISFEQLPQSNGGLLYRVVNLNSAVMQGGEISVRYKAYHWLNATLSYNFLDARDTSEGSINDALAYKAKHMMGFSVVANYKRWNLGFDGRYRSAIEEVFIYPGNEPDAYFLWNARLSCQMSKSNTIYFALSNGGNTQYEELERYRMAGRSFALGVDLAF